MQAYPPLIEDSNYPARLIECRSHALDLLGYTLADHQNLVAVAEAEGIDAAAFRDEDLRLFWCAMDVARAHGRAAVLSLAKRALWAADYWCNAGPFQFGPLWTPQSLAALADGYFVSESLTRHYARMLIDAERRLDRFERLIGEATEALATPPRQMKGAM